MSNKEEWIISECKLLEDGAAMEVKFIHKFDKRWHHNLTMPADSWLSSMCAVNKLFRIEESFKRLRDVIEGRA